MNLMLVGGTFDCRGGRPSRIVRELIDVVRPFRCVNGGDVTMLSQIRFEGADVVVWMPKVDNAEPKEDVRRIKERFPRVLLVTSKENYDGRYSLPDLVAHALSLKSNLLIEISGQGRKLARLIDPLGNVWSETSYWDELGCALLKRLDFLAGLTRIRSQHVVHNALSRQYSSAVVPEEPEFFDVVRSAAETFHALIQPPPGMTRFLGNATFRCKHGFPAFRGSDGLLFVSRRNVDKRLVGTEMFVPVAPYLGWSDNLREGQLCVQYFGPHKPSVDTPVMIKLFGAFGDRARYAMHGHVYVKDVPMTKQSLPCGCLEEFDEILTGQNWHGWYADRRLQSCMELPFAMNLRGHGFIALSEDVAFLAGLEYVPRPVWERGAAE